MDFDFSEEFGPASETPLQKLRQQWSNRRPSRLHGSPASPRPQELFPSPRQGQSSSPSPGSPSSALATPNEDAFVSTKASLRRREYEKLEMWISSGGAVEDFAPWFREMLADQDDDCLVSALRAVAAHYRRAAQQQALGEEDSGVPVPLCWLAPLAERLMSCASGLVAHEASELVAACLACTERSSAPHQATFFQRFATLSRGKVHLLAACQAVLQPEDWQDMLRLVRQSAREELPKDTWRRLPEELKNLAKELEPTAASPLPVRPTEDSAGAEAWSDTPKTWRQRVRCLEHLAERGDVRNLWPQLVLQVEDDHPAVSAAALHCLACRAPQMTPPAEHLLCRLAQARLLQRGGPLPGFSGGGAEPRWLEASLGAAASSNLFHGAEKNTAPARPAAMPAFPSLADAAKVGNRRKGTAITGTGHVGWWIGTRKDYQGAIDEVIFQRFKGLTHCDGQQPLPVGLSDCRARGYDVCRTRQGLLGKCCCPIGYKVVGRKCLPCTGTVERVNAWHKLPLVYVLHPETGRFAFSLMCLWSLVLLPLPWAILAQKMWRHLLLREAQQDHVRHYLVHHQRPRMAETWWTRHRQHRQGPMAVWVSSMSGQTKELSGFFPTSLLAHLRHAAADAFAVPFGGCCLVMHHAALQPEMDFKNLSDLGIEHGSQLCLVHSKERRRQRNSSESDALSFFGRTEKVDCEHEAALLHMQEAQEGWQCNACERHFEVPTMLWRCEICNVDFCGECSAEAEFFNE